MISTSFGVGVEKIHSNGDALDDEDTSSGRMDSLVPVLFFYLVLIPAMWSAKFLF